MKGLYEPPHGGWYPQIENHWLNVHLYHSFVYWERRQNNTITQYQNFAGGQRIPTWPLPFLHWLQLCTLHDWWPLPWIPLFPGGSVTPPPCRPKFAFGYHACLVLHASFFSSAWPEKQGGSRLPLLSYILSRVNSHYHPIKHHAPADSSQIYFCGQHVSLEIPCASLTCPGGISTWVLYNQWVSYISILMSHEYPKNAVFHVYDFGINCPIRILTTSAGSLGFLASLFLYSVLRVYLLAYGLWYIRLLQFIDFSPFYDEFLGMGFALPS